MGLLLTIVAGILIAAAILLIGIPWLAGIMFALRMGDWKGAWNAFRGKFD
jgi:hypothetical protein